MTPFQAILQLDARHNYWGCAAVEGYIPALVRLLQGY